MPIECRCLCAFTAHNAPSIYIMSLEHRNCEVACRCMSLEHKEWECSSAQAKAHLGIVSCCRPVGGAAAALAEAAIGLSIHLGRAPPGGPILAILPHIYAALVQHLQA